jgi:hypothetical protein
MQCVEAPASVEGLIQHQSRRTTLRIYYKRVMRVMRVIRIIRVNMIIRIKGY